VFRGVAFEFRFKHAALRRFWDGAFCGGSLVATFAQGVVLGAFIQGFKIDGREFAGTSFDWLAPFPLAIGLALVFGYALLGATWLVLKTEGELQDWARRAAAICLIAVLAAVAAVSIWTPLAHPQIAQRWFSWPNIAFLSPVPIVTALIALGEWEALRRRYELAPFLGAVALFLMSFAGIAISLWPMIVPYRYRCGRRPRRRARRPFC
jgi:cytochrome d ubiquinol oxidase subunit II